MDEEEDSKIFPQKLMDILSDPDPVVQESICWLPHGKAFIIRNRGQFEQHVMPQFFNRKAKYSSFTRKLNRWNFSRVSSGPELGAYYHEFFRRDRPHLAAQMFCKNPRTMLAMQESKAKSERPVAAEHYPANLGFNAGMHSNAGRPTNAMLGTGMAGLTASELDKLSDRSRNLVHHQSLASLAALPPHPNAQILERQILLLQQQEEANRLLLERALLLRQQRQAVGGLANLTEEQKLQDEQSLYLRQLLGIPARRGESRTKPSNNRASAA